MGHSIITNVLCEHDGLSEIDDHKEEEDTREIELEFLIRLKGKLTIQPPFLEEQGWPVELFVSVKQRTGGGDKNTE